MFHNLLSFGNRFISQIRTSSAVHPNLVVLRRAVHASVYDKNIEDQIRPSLVPEEAVTRAKPEKYWVPDPKTGVFGPAGEKSTNAASGFEPTAVNGSVLE
ncbi:putative Late embryogenesis abundant protein, LEA_3 subgroup [Helianthus annuus]|nr:putative Late embryogenesis abundant protein, LEA_3 subgroup [Helianthus annuus]